MQPLSRVLERLLLIAPRVGHGPFFSYGWGVRKESAVSSRVFIFTGGSQADNKMMPRGLDMLSRHPCEALYCVTANCDSTVLSRHHVQNSLLTALHSDCVKGPNLQFHLIDAIISYAALVFVHWMLRKYGSEPPPDRYAKVLLREVIQWNVLDGFRAEKLCINGLALRQINDEDF
ncbi:hypothetical protein Tco_0567720 [Tanacetum coccineum]